MGNQSGKQQKWMNGALGLIWLIVAFRNELQTSFRSLVYDRKGTV